MTRKSIDNLVNIVLPSFGDIKSALEVCEEIERKLTIKCRIFILDDSAGVDKYPKLPTNYFRIIASQNLGQQTILTEFFKIFLSLSELKQISNLIVVLDADGEDKPLDVIRMLELAIENPFQSKIILAERRQREVPFIFKISYKLFQLIGKFLTGIYIKHGTFCVINSEILSKHIENDSFKYSFVGGLASIPTNKTYLPCDRGKRRYGQSHLNFKRLIEHGLEIYIALDIKLRNLKYLKSILLTLFTLELLLIYSTIQIAKKFSLASISISIIFSLPILLLIILFYSIKIVSLKKLKSLENFQNKKIFKNFPTISNY